MKVRGPGNTQGPNKTKKAPDASATDGSFGKLMAGGNEPAAATTNTQNIAQVDALLAIQGAEDPTQGATRKRMRRRADTLLNTLDTLKDSLLGGQLTVGDMIDVADVVASHREKIDDPELTNIMDEIDLRAQVELAKMRVALDNQQNNS
ncbi:MAG: flagellar assembly protein FliX [Bdellovibrionales bacterium]